MVKFNFKTTQQAQFDPVANSYALVLYHLGTRKKERKGKSKKKNDQARCDKYSLVGSAKCQE